MALYPCRECGGRISEDALVCPQCGAGDPLLVSRARSQTRRERMKWGAAWIVIVLWLLALFA
jgi:predicted nucleic acid-binding Zn ribbon protein